MAKQPGIQSATRTEFRQLATLRLADAKALQAAAQWAGAYYLVGYAIESALKACLIKKFVEKESWPSSDFKAIEFYTHDLAALIGQARLESVLMNDVSYRPFWLELQNWSEQTRYNLNADEQNTIQLIGAVEEVLRWFEAN